MSTGQYNREDFQFLTDDQFNALPRMITALGTPAVMQILQLPQSDQITSIRMFLRNERLTTQFAYQQAMINNHNTTGDKSLKLKVSTYSGNESENLLRWFTELEMALSVRRFATEEHKVAFSMSHLGGRAKNWAYGCRMQNRECFPPFIF
jgi:hypothetical protein